MNESKMDVAGLVEIGANEASQVVGGVAVPNFINYLVDNQASRCMWDRG